VRTTPRHEGATAQIVSTLETSVQVADTHSGVIVATVEVAGEIDAVTASSLDDAFDEALEAHPTLVLFDAGSTTFLDSVGLRAVVRNAEKVRQRRARFRLSGASAAARRVLEIADLLDRYEHG
jgi:anti-anti-sigma factor